ncbi:hypothetical protein ILUMI_21860 [Ignelater luminosus]|uniref:Uncharacterized protein n=1 Tax=Ignelater luminosus TaxID=2038154 RepID=A0A8K0CGX2_IGNLU|nr:hypothetical protein ILUMI_21860 [Ignelater luminosus]
MLLPTYEDSKLRSRTTLRQEKIKRESEKRAVERRSKVSQSLPRPRANAIADINVEIPNTTRQERDRKRARQETSKEEKEAGICTEAQRLKAKLIKMKQNIKHLQK